MQEAELHRPASPSRRIPAKQTTREKHVLCADQHRRTFGLHHPCAGLNAPHEDMKPNILLEPGSLEELSDARGRLLDQNSHRKTEHEACRPRPIPVRDTMKQPAH